MTYNFKTLQEIGWLAVVTVIGFVAIQVSAVDPSGITDWKAWAVALAIGAGRAVIAAIAAKFGSGGFTKS